MQTKRKANRRRSSFLSRRGRLVGQPLDRRLRLEPLEDRRMLATLIVNSVQDNVTSGDGLVTLREAIVAANNDTITDLGLAGFGVDTIRFATNVFDTPKTIFLELGEIEITEEATIEGSGQQLLAIDAQQNSRIFDFTATTGDLTIAGLSLTGGRTTASSLPGRGGAIRLSPTGSLTIDQSTISGNSTVGDLADGGAIYSLGAVTLTQSTVSGNSTDGHRADGGAIFARGVVTLTQSTVSGNSTAGDYGRGGGILSVGAVTLTHSTVSGNNTAGVEAYGGGIFSLGPVTLTHSTVAANHADHATATGGGIWDFDDPIVIANSIVAGNTAGGGMNDIDPGTGTLNIDFSLIEDTTGLTINGGDNITGMSANLGPLADNAGLTQTHALLPGSPAIDAGGTTTLVNDQRGAPFVRVFDDPMAAGTGIDMGAYERQTLPGLSLVVDTPVDENDGDTSAGDLSLREAVDLTRGSVGDDTIMFDTTVFATPQTILLGLGEIEITEAVTIDGPGQQLLTIDAQQNSRIFNITATTGDFTLAGLSLTGGRMIVDSTFSDSIGRGGAIRSLTADSLTIDHSTVSGNSTAGDDADGGGIFSFFGGTTLNQSTVSGNSTAGGAARGGGIFSFYNVTLTNSTVTNNHTDQASGGGIWNYSDPIMIANSIVAGNTAGGGMNDIDPGTGPLNVDFSLIGDTTGLTIVGNGNITGLPANLGLLASNGGPTQTHALLADNLAINAGDPAASPGVGNVPLFDQRGNNYGRVQNGRIDIGAFEVRDTLSADFDSDGFISGFDFLLWQIGFGTIAPDATKPDGDGDNDLDTDDNDLSVWESQFGQPAPVTAAVSLPVVETLVAAEPSAAFQVEVTATLTPTPEVYSASRLAWQRLRLPANFIARPNDLGLGFRLPAPRQVQVKAQSFTEPIDEAFNSAWYSLPEQNRDLTSDGLVRATHGHSAIATRPADEAFAELADEEGFAGLRPSL